MSSQSRAPELRQTRLPVLTTRMPSVRHIVRCEPTYGESHGASRFLRDIRSLVLLVVVASCLAPGSPAIAQAPYFRFIDAPPTFGSTRPLGVSADGRAVAGISIGENSSIQGFTWSPDGGRVDWSGINPLGSPHGVSGDGRSIVGSFVGPDGRGTAFRRVGDGPLESLGIGSGWRNSQGLFASFDGQTVAGVNTLVAGGEIYRGAYMWTPADGMRSLERVAQATQWEPTSVSRDGSTITGWSYADSGTTRQAPVVWRNGLSPTILPLVPDFDRYGGVANDTSADGRLIVGTSFGDGGNRGVRWIDGVLNPLPLFFDYRDSSAFQTTDDGSMVLGGLRFSPTGLPDTNFVWFSSGEGMTLDDYWARNGVVKPDRWHIDLLTSMSGDGSTIIGTVRHLDTHQTMGFVAAVPAPGTAAITLVIGGMAFLRSRRLT